MQSYNSSWKQKLNPGLITVIKTYQSIMDQAVIAEENDLGEMYEKIMKNGLRSFKCLYENGLEAMMLLCFVDIGI